MVNKQSRPKHLDFCAKRLMACQLCSRLHTRAETQSHILECKGPLAFIDKQKLLSQSKSHAVISNSDMDGPDNCAIHFRKKKVKVVTESEEDPEEELQCHQCFATYPRKDQDAHNCWRVIQDLLFGLQQKNVVLSTKCEELKMDSLLN